MEQKTIQTLFALLRSALCGTTLTENERNNCSPEIIKDLLKISIRHDVLHLLALGLEKNALVSNDNTEIQKCILKAAYRHKRLSLEYESLCNALEAAKIPFIPLKGAVISKYYPEAWMRTSCDIDVLVHREDLEPAVAFLTEKLHYVEDERTPHDISLFSPTKVNVEIHFDLIEEGRAKNSIDVLQSVWENVTLSENSEYCYEMSDAFFYFYHIAHMAKHFENGGCGIRPFIDLWILDNLTDINKAERFSLLSKGGLTKFADVTHTLSQVWFNDKQPDELSLKTQHFLLSGGIYGSANNRVSIQQTQKGGKFKYILSRIFIPFAKLKRYYPILDKHPWLTPFMQIRRWFMLLRPKVAKLAKRELSININLEKTKSDEMNNFLENIGLG